MRWITKGPSGLLVALVAIAIAATAPAIAAAGSAQVKGVAASGKGPGTTKGKIGVKAAHASSWNFTPTPGVVAQRSPRSEARTGLDARVGSLPFTGWDLIILGGVSMVLGGTGVMLRRLSMPRAPRS